MGVTNNFLQWISELLSQRKYKAAIDGENVSLNYFGVPQGNVDGTLLYLIIANE